MKSSICLFATALFASLIMAQSVSKELATEVALQYMKNDISNAAPSDYALLIKNNLIDTTYTHLFSLSGKAPLYLIQMPEGWVLVSSEYVKTPILASSPAGQFPDAADMPDGLKWLLSYYEDAMKYTRDNYQLIMIVLNIFGNTDMILRLQI